MTFYIEVAFLNVVSLLLLICMLTIILNHSNPSYLFIKTIGVAILLFTYNNIIMQFVLLFIYLFNIFDHDYANILLSIILYLLIITSAPYLIYSKIDGIILYPDSNYLSLICVFFLILVLFYLLLPLFKRLSLKSRYIYDFKLNINEYILIGSGYLDSGNSSSFNHFPLIYLKYTNSLEEVFNKADYIKVKSKGISDNVECLAYFAEIEINNRKRMTYVVFDESIDLNINYDALLNIMLLDWRG